MNPKLSAVGLALLITAPHVFGADASGNYAVWGVGQASCNQFATAYEAQSFNDYKHYLSGYLTAFNTVAEGVYQGTRDNSLDDNLRAIHEYCETHRMDSFERAIQGLLTQIGGEDGAKPEESVRWGRPPAPTKSQ
jgi:hypothetical protein